MNAHEAVGNALRYGMLEKRPCERCGNHKAVAHHEDYSKPLDVTWLCTKCHAARHVELRGLGERMGTSLRIKPETLGELKMLALQKRVRVNDVILEAIENYLALYGRLDAA